MFEKGEFILPGAWGLLLSLDLMEIAQFFEIGEFSLPSQASLDADFGGIPLSVPLPTECVALFLGLDVRWNLFCPETTVLLLLVVIIGERECPLLSSRLANHGTTPALGSIM